MSAFALQLLASSLVSRMPAPDLKRHTEDAALDGAGAQRGFVAGKPKSAHPAVGTLGDPEPRLWSPWDPSHRGIPQRGDV